MKEGLGKIYKLGAYSVVVRLPKSVVEDSAFPFKLGDAVKVVIDGDKIIILKGGESDAD
jgi:antitoxin component of MazEF toxin-antitoxin module